MHPRPPDDAPALEPGQPAGPVRPGRGSRPGSESSCPGDDVLRAAVPWFEDPLVFLPSPGEMSRESWFLYEDGTADGQHQTGRFQYVWREVAPTFSAFAEALGLVPPER